MNRETHEMLSRLERVGIGYSDAAALRRAAMVLHRWFELECGMEAGPNGLQMIERDENGDGPPYRVVHQYRNGPPLVTRYRIPDRETSARKRIVAILAKYPDLKLRAYIQTDPRGAPVYLLRPGDIPEGEDDPLAYYSRGIAVHA